MGWKICVQKNSCNLTFYSTRQVPDYFCYIMVDVQALLETLLNMSLRFSCCSNEAFSGKKRNLWSGTTYLQVPDYQMQD